MRDKELCVAVMEISGDPMILSEFGRSIVVGTMQSMQRVANREGMPSWDH